MTADDPNADLEIDRALKDLDPSDIDDWRKEKIRRQAHRALKKGPGRVFAVWYDRVLEPAWVAGVGIIYLGWALEVLRFLHQ